MKGAHITKITVSGDCLVTIITVVLNEKYGLEKTIQSVINQTCKNIEHIIIDGGSTDGTLDVIKKYQHVIHAWISEPDKGIYDAMNKGIRLANGEWVNFMNAGDVFYDSDTLNSLKKYFLQDSSLIYGDVRINYDHFERTQYAKSLSLLWRGGVYCHQSGFIKKQILAKLMFNLDYNLAADYELLCRIYLGGYPITKVDIIISKVINKGAADFKRIEALREFLKIASRNFKIKAPIIFIRYQNLILLERLKRCIKKYLPHPLTSFFVRHKYR